MYKSEQTESVKPEHIQHLCQRLSMPSKHCKETFDPDHVSAGRKHVKGRYGIYLELYPALKLTSHKLLIAATTIQVFSLILGGGCTKKEEYQMKYQLRM